MSLYSLLSRLSLQCSTRVPISNRSISTNKQLLFRITPCLWGEPLKKKKRIDPALIKAREERKKKKIEKQIRKLEKNARQLKPIEECEIPLCVVEKKKEHQRHISPISVDELERRVLLEKQWAKYKRDEHLKDIKMIDRILYSQQKALDELRKESEELYLEAIQTDFQLVPFETSGATNTPAIEKYEIPDGDYQDVSKKWE